MNALSLPAIIFSLFAVGENDMAPITFADTGYRVHIADSPFEQMRGLMGRSNLGFREGMLFVYSQDRQVAFWMKNVSFPLDMIFFDRCGRVIQIHENAQPDDTTTIASVAPVRAVLEIRGGS